jgi:gliding motility-associated-like protein
MMKKITLLFLLLLPIFVFAQPENDDCAGLIDLGVAPTCPDTVYFSNVDATSSDIGFGNIPSCFNGGVVGNDVWFAFTTSDTIFDYTITATGIADPDGSTPLSSPQVALYRGICEFDNLAEIACVSTELGTSVVELDVEGLTPGVTYFIRITDYSATGTPNWGTFQLCVEEQEPASTIDEGGSTSCSGLLYDSGGPDEDYGNTENNVFTICPDQPHDCILFTMNYYNLEPGGFLTTDVISFFDGDGTDSPLLAQLGDGDFLNNDEGGGGVCFQVQATSGCLTVQFTTDGTNTFEGFEGEWECQQNCEPLQPIVVNGNVTEEDIVNFVSTPDVTAEITNINCPEESYGTFEGGDMTNLGLERGLLLTSGSRNYAVGPNTGGGGGSPGTDNGAPGDPDLDYLSTVFGGGTTSQNACVVELDVFVATDELSFEYVFGSEEYPEFVNTTFNDIFAFLVSGPGIMGDPNLSNSAINIATLPDGTPVQINSVNNLLNWEFYRNNLGGSSIQYDGMTSDFLGVKKSLTASIGVEPCNTYSLKLAIADRGDSSYDSGVFVSELKGGTPSLTVQFNSGIDYLVEDCVNQDDEVVVSLTDPVEDTTSFIVTVTGTAENGLDYLLEIPDSVIFLPGQNELSFPLTTLSDLLTEGTETIILTLSNDFGCGEVVYTELVVELRDQINVEIDAGQDTVLVCSDSSIVLSATGAASFFWSPVSIFDEPTSSSPTASPMMSQWVQVEGIVGPCVDIDSVYLQIIDPEIMAFPQDSLAICQGDTVQLNSTNNTNNSNLTWAPAVGLSDSTILNPVAQPEVTTDYIVSVNVAGCVVQDSVHINVAPFDFPEIQADTIICENYGVQLASFIDLTETTTTYQWSPDIGLDNDTISNPIAFPEQTTTYQLIAESGNGACADTAAVTVTVLPANIDIIGPDSLEICLGTVVDLEAETSTGDGETLIWSPDNGTISDTSGLTTQVTTEVTDWYFAEFTLGACTVFDSIHIRVDSLPATLITPDPEKEKYCEGEIVTLTSPVYEPGFYPDIEFGWIDPLGAETADTLWNMVLTLQDTFFYQRVTTNRACVDTASILINVQAVPLATITPSDSIICLGDAVDFQLEITGQYDSFEWMGSGLSCTDCFDPTASPASGQYMVEIDADGCDASVSATIQPVEPPFVPNNETICPGESAELNLGEPFGPNDSFEWTSSDPDFSSTEPNPVVSPAETTTYFVVVNNGVCPPLEGEVTITISDFATITSVDVSPTDLCQNEEVEFTIEATNLSEGDLFEWTDPNGQEVLSTTNTSGSFNPTVSGTYTLIYINANECGTLSETFELTVEEAPVTAVIGDQTICLGESAQLNLAADEVSTYTWTSTDPDFNDNDNPLPVVSPTQTSSYTLVASNGICPDVEETVTVEVIQDAVINSITAEPASLCQGETTTLSVDIANLQGEDSVVWTAPDGSTAGEGASITIDNPVSGTYTVSYSSGFGCGELGGTVDIDVLPIPVVGLAGDTTICLGESVQLNFASDEGTTYTWTSTDPLFSDFNNPEPVVSPNETATYTLTASNGVCDDFTGTVTVEVIGNIVLDILPEDFFLCPGSSTNIVAEAFGGSSEQTFTWTGSDGSTYTGDSITVMPEDSTVYTLVYESGGGCATLIDSVLIEVGDGVFPTGAQIIQEVPMDLFEGDSVFLGVNYTSPFDPSELQFTWTVTYEDSTTVLQNGFGLDTIQTQVFNSGVHIFQVAITTPDGCSYFASTQGDFMEIIVAIPNTFTPNRDDVNDFFNFLAQANIEDLEVLEFKVYNRWGQLVYDNETPDDGWDGNFNGKEQPTEVYFYLIRIARPNGFELGAFQGDVTLIR